MGKKPPKNPKKPGRVRYILPNTDSNQGCRTAALIFVHAGRAAPQPPADPRLGIRRTCIARAPTAYRASVPHAPAPPHALAEHRPHIRTTRPPRHAYPSLTLRRSLIYPPFLSHPPRTVLHPSRATRTSPAPSPPVCTRIRRPLPRRSSHVPSAHRTSVPHAPATTARLPAEVLKLQDFSFYQSISNFVVSLPNVSEKDVKGLLFRK